jgi:L-fucose isomerase-like protein
MASSAAKPVTLGVVVGNRGFFPSHLIEAGRAAVLDALEAEGIRAITLSTGDAPYGSVENLDDANKCAALLRAHRDEIDGVLVTLPNFGDERAVANTLRRAELNVPVLVHAFSDEAGRMDAANRRDSFCGKISVCNNLHQYGIPYSLTELHTVNPAEESFHEDLRRFAAICRVVDGLKNLRVGMIGARPAAFNTVRFSEKLLERAGITTETLDLSEVFGRADGLVENDPAVKAKHEEIQTYLPANGVPADALVRLAKLGVVIDNWMTENELEASAIQCWTALEEYYGVVPCVLMSIMSERLMPSACETDILGAVAMLALARASGKPSAIVDWNNNYGADPNKGVLFHCSNLPRGVFVENAADPADNPVITFQPIFANTLSQEQAYGSINGRMRSGPFTFCRISTDDLNGRITAYVGEGQLTNDPIKSWGGYGVFEIPNLQKLMHYVCEHGLEHHVAVNMSHTVDVMREALGKYMNWDVYQHNAS